MKRVLAIATLFAALWLQRPVFASPDPGGAVLVTGYLGRAGSLTGGADADAPVVYVFLDTVDRRLDLAFPSGTTLTLNRDGVPVTGFVEVPLTAVMPPPDIAALYALPGGARRMAETMASLDGLLDDDAPIDALSFPVRLHDALATFRGEALPPYPEALAARRLFTWSQLAARADPFVSVAGYRAFIDRSPPSDAVVTYTFIVAHGARSAEIGRVQVDTSAGRHRVPAPADLEDRSLDQSRCDSPTAGRADGATALYWSHPGANETERWAIQNDVVGYDVWMATRETGCANADPIDFGLLAAAGTSDHKGALSIPGYVRVTDAPLLIQTDRAVDPSLGPGWQPRFAQLIHDKAALRSLGFQPGDIACYWVVARDRSGNYGESAGLTVQIPDLIPPVAPWDVTAVPVREAAPIEGQSVDAAVYEAAVEVADRFELYWTDTWWDLWVAARLEGRVLCDHELARSRGRVRVAASPADCAERALELRLDDSDFLVYRFPDAETAADFQDHDGDGVDDRSEGADALGPGAACDPADQAGPSYLAQGTFEWYVPAPDGRPGAIRWIDDGGPEVEPGRVYWYRVAAVSSNGVVSELSPPVRGLFPATTMPDRPAVEDIGLWTCGVGMLPESAPIDDRDDLTVHPEDHVPAEVLSRFGPSLIAWDGTGKAAAIRTSCVYVPPNRDVGDIYDNTTPEERLAGLRATLPFTPTGAGGAALADEALCATLCDDIDFGFILLEVVDAQGQVLAARDFRLFQQAPPGSYPSGCGFFAVVEPRCDSEGGEPVRAGDVVDDPEVFLRIPLATSEDCAQVGMNVAGRRFKLGSICGPATAEPNFTFPVPQGGPTLSCLTVSTLSRKGRIPSTTLPLPCFKTRTKLPPSPPRVGALTLLEGASTTCSPGGEPCGPGSFTWFGPEQDVAGILAEWWQQGDDQRRSGFFGAAGLRGANAEHVATGLDLGGALPPGESQTWCVRARSLSASTASDLGGTLSDWSGTMCGNRVVPVAGDPGYIPWPARPKTPRIGVPLPVEYLVSLGEPGTEERLAVPAIVMGEIPEGRMPIGSGTYNPGGCAVCGCDDGVRCVPEAISGSLVCSGDVVGPRAFFGCTICAEVDGAIGDRGGFVAYRQYREDPGDAASDFIQVSPLITHPFCGLVPDGNLYYGRVDDPYFRLVPRVPSGGNTAGPARWELTWLDRSPHAAGRQYRYQFVYFDARGEPSGYRETDWFTIPAGLPQEMP